MNNRQSIIAVISREVTAAMEDMAFVELLYIDDLQLEDLSGSFHRVSIKIIKPMEAKFIVALSTSLLMEITENIYGLEIEKVTPEMEGDVLSEILNTISGRIMKGITPASQIYELGLPETDLSDGNTEKNSRIDCIFEADEGKYLILSFIMDVPKI